VLLKLVSSGKSLAQIETPLLQGRPSEEGDVVGGEDWRGSALQGELGHRVPADAGGYVLHWRVFVAVVLSLVGLPNPSLRLCTSTGRDEEGRRAIRERRRGRERERDAGGYVLQRRGLRGCGAGPRGSPKSISPVMSFNREGRRGPDRRAIRERRRGRERERERERERILIKN
jgi:hypothetical protein